MSSTALVTVYAALATILLLLYIGIVLVRAWWMRKNDVVVLISAVAVLFLLVCLVRVGMEAINSGPALPAQAIESSPD